MARCSIATQPAIRSASATIAEGRPVIEIMYGAMVGGSETLAFNLCKEWRARGVPVRLCCLYGDGGPMTRFYDEAGVPYDLLRLDELSFYRRWRRLVAYLREHRPIGLHVHHFGFLVNVLPAAYAVGCTNVVYTEHSIFRIMQKAWMRWMLPWCARRVRKMTCVSEALTTFFRDGMRIAPDRITTVYNGIDTDLFSPRSPQCEGRSVPVIGAVGRLVEEKDYPNLVNALALLKRRSVAFHARIVGDGPLRSHIQTLAQELGVAEQIRFEGSRHDVASFLREVDVYVLSSKHEGLPIALMEAMSSGLPIVSTTVGGVPELIRNGMNGLLVARQDPGGLADALASLLSDGRLRRRFGEAACRDARARFSIRATAERYAELLNIELPVRAKSYQ